MKKTFLILVLLFFCFSFIYAQDPFDNLSYPIVELGNCENKEICGVFCDQEENIKDCLDYAEDHNLISKEEIEIGRLMLELGESGPGGCKSKDECESYCDDISHMEECIIFAEKHGLIPDDELEDAKKVLKAIKQGIKPPNCNGKTECDIYCFEPEHMEECLVFGEAAGLIPANELEDAKKVLKAIKQGIKPPNCRGEVECDEYCSQPENFEECITFAEAAGFMSAEEAEMARRTGGKGPGGCQRDECDTYCDDPAHTLECLEFALEYGFMPPEEVERAKRMLEMGIIGGPGGCTGEENCKAFCDNPDNTRECIEFGVKIGDISRGEADKILQDMEKGKMGGPGGCQSEEECRIYCENPDNIEECINFSVDQGLISPEEVQQMDEQKGEQFKIEQEIKESMMPSPEEIKEMRMREEEKYRTENAPQSLFEQSSESFLAEIVNFFDLGR